MEALHLIPTWFLGLDLTFEILFCLFTALIAAYSFKIYKISEQKESKNFALAFTFLSLSYLVLIFLNSWFLSIITGNVRILDIDDFIGMKNLLVLSYTTFLILGFVTLFCTTLKAKSPSIFIALVSISLFSIFSTCNKSLIMFAIPSLLLLFITFFYFKEYRETKNNNTLLFGIAMLLLLASNIYMTFVGDYSSSNCYVISRFLEMAAYIIIILDLFSIIKNGKKKKQIRGN